MSSLSDPEAVLFCDLALARRLERAEATANAGFVESRAQLFPDSGACWIDVGGTYAMFDTPTSPSTQSFGMGLFEPAGDADLDRLEAFFRERGAGVFHEVSSLASPALLPLLHARGYAPLETTSVLVRPLSAEPSGQRRGQSDRLSVRLIREGEEQRFADLGARGWTNAEGLEEFLGDFLREYGLISARRSACHSFFAEWDGEPIASGGLFVDGDVALFAGASTVPEARNRGAQLALLEARLEHAARLGCEVAMMAALPGSSSQRNAERNGFRLAYTRIKWELRRG